MECNGGNARRKTLLASVSCLLTEVGFDTSEKIALETLTEMLQSFLTELGKSSRGYYELAGRTSPVIGDIIIALVGMGISVDGIEAHAKRVNRSVVATPIASSQPKQLPILQAGSKQTPPAHIPEYLPAFPDPHAYIRTPTHKQPVTEYEAIREKSAIQKKDLERALTRFVAKTGEQHSVFLTPDNNTTNIFPLIPCKAGYPPYLNALLPKDQVFDLDEFEVTQVFRKPPPVRLNEDSVEGLKAGDEPIKSSDSETIDNPYLRPVKMPKKMK